jgi:hypothetical protein
VGRRAFIRWQHGKRAQFDQWRYANSPLAPLAFLGDSHVAYFSHAARRGYFGRRRYNACAVNGATAVGLRNPNATTNALEIFTHYLARTDPGAVVVMQLGEVDCGFVIWYRAEKYRDGIDEQLDQAIAAYFAFIDDARARGHANFVITGSTVPTIQDGRDWGAVANARRAVSASLEQRTELTRRYNRRLAELALARGLPFIDIWDETIDPTSGVVRPEFLHRRATDHHMDPARAAACWGPRLAAVLPAFDPRRP